MKELLKKAGEMILLYSGHVAIACAFGATPSSLGNANQEAVPNAGLNPQQERQQQHYFDPRDESDEGKINIAAAMRPGAARQFAFLFRGVSVRCSHG